MFFVIYTSRIFTVPIEFSIDLTKSLQYLYKVCAKIIDKEILMRTIEKCAIVDIGSNTIRMNIYEVADGVINELLSKKKMLGMSNYVEDDKLTEKGIKKCIKVLADYKDTLEKMHIDDVYPFGTAGIRNIKNSEEVLQRIKDGTSLKVDLISGENEADCVYRGVSSIYDATNCGIVDIGGGSTEIIIVEDGNVKNEISMPIGSLNLHHSYINTTIFPQKDEVKNIKRHIKSVLDDYKISKFPKGMKFYGVGGSIRAAGEIAEEYFWLENDEHFSKEHVKEILDKIMEKDPEILRVMLKECPDRIHTQTPGMLILSELMKDLKFDSISVSSAGVREGYLIDKLEGMK